MYREPEDADVQSSACKRLFMVSNPKAHVCSCTIISTFQSWNNFYGPTGLFRSPTQTTHHLLTSCRPASLRSPPILYSSYKCRYVLPTHFSFVSSAPYSTDTLSVLTSTSQPSPTSKMKFFLTAFLAIFIPATTVLGRNLCPDANLRECYDYCDVNNPDNAAFVACTHARCPYCQPA